MTGMARGENMCFGCSTKNPIGLKLAFERDGEVCRAHFTAGPEHQGWQGVVHGGLVATILDEVMAQWLWQHEIATMTAEMTVRYSKLVPVGERLTIESRPVSGRGRLVQMAAKVILPDGSVAARAKAKFLKIKPEKDLRGAD